MSSFEELIISVVGIVIGLILLFFNRRASRTLVGSFFKQYYDLSMIAVILLICSFLVKLLIAFGIDVETGSLIHYVLLLLAGVVFVFTSIALPKEASAYMKRGDVENTKPSDTM